MIANATQPWRRGAVVKNQDSVLAIVIDEATGQTISLEQAADLFRVLGNEIRLDIIWALLESKGELSVTQLCTRGDVTQSAISWSLGLLGKAGLVKSRWEGRNHFYSLAGSDELDLFCRTCIEQFTSAKWRQGHLTTQT